MKSDRKYPCRKDGCGSVFNRKRNRNLHELGKVVQQVKNPMNFKFLRLN